MRVKLSIVDRMMLKLAWMLNNLSFAISGFIHKKYDPEHAYNTRTYNGKKCSEIIFSNEEES